MAYPEGMVDICNAWHLRRFAGLVPADFEFPTLFFAPPSLTCPPGFEQVWVTYFGDARNQPLLAPGVGAALGAVIFISDPTKEEHQNYLRHFISQVDNVGHVAPPMLWVPSSAPPEDVARRRLAEHAVEVQLHSLLEFGLDGVVPSEHESFDLALAARAFVRRCQGFAKTLTNMVNESRSQAEQVEFLKDCIHGIMWEYLRARVAPCIPPVDYNIPAGEVVQMHQYSFTQLLGKGAYGSVYRIQDQTQPQNALVGECMKVVSKHTVLSINDLKSAKRGIEVMKLVSSAQHQHPNVVQTYDIYHSQTHIFFRMEYAGPENLFRRLAHRQKDPPQTRPISAAIARAIFVQAIHAVTHLHLSPSVCHRDIKPENFVVLESNGGVIVKLADFDLALHCPRDTLLRSPCGTFPFTAPEVMVEREYNGFAADIWSLGIVLFEVLCGVRVVERLFLLQGLGGTPDATAIKRIRAGFEEPGSAARHLSGHFRAELSELANGAAQLIDGMLNVNRLQRVEATQARQLAGAVAQMPL